MLKMRELHRKLISAFVSLDGYTIDPEIKILLLRLIHIFKVYKCSWK
jgi:hypothetical protein